MTDKEIIAMEEIEKDLRILKEELQQESEKLRASGVIAKAYKKISEVIEKVGMVIDGKKR